MEQRVIVLSGLTACGKTTASKVLQSRFAFELASTHAIKSAFRLRDTCSERERNRAYAELYRQASGALAQGGSIILDAGFNTRDQRASVHRLVQVRGAKLYLVSCICEDLSVIRERMERRALAPLLPEHQAYTLATYHHVKRTAQPVEQGELPAGASLLVYDTLHEHLSIRYGDAFAWEIWEALRAAFCLMEP
jgi:predicted kinase